MKDTIKRIVFNWFFTIENGKEYEFFEVGKNGVKEIYYRAGNSGIHYCDVYLEDSTHIRVFNINEIIYQ